MKRITASLLIGLFVFIHVVKAYHNHEAVVTHTHSSSNEFMKVKADCDICKYHFVQNGALLFCQPIVASPSSLGNVYFTSSARISTSVGLLSANKGPPSQA
ncbi:MAG: hypothetical protein ABIP35_12755 [Ginsengibacter sp.]